VATDYILRLVDQMTRMLAEILLLRKQGRAGEAIDRLEAICLESVGLPLDLARRSSPETILQLLESGGAKKYMRAVMLAELLLQDAELNEEKGESREGFIRRAQARALLAASIDHLSPEDQASYRPKLEALNEEFRSQ
jgi:hypothetical protein